MSSIAPGQLVGSYRVVRLLGEGGMGAVYEVLNETLGRRAALKVLHAEFARDPDIKARFLQEAQVANRIRHPSIVQITEFNQLPDGSSYFVMEYLEGESLRARLERAAGEPDKRLGTAGLSALRQVAQALAAFHKQGLVHRDLKPGNIMLVPDPEVDERAKVLDFGISKIVQGVSGASPAAVQTRTGSVMGTPQYMAPEQWRNAKEIDGKVDVYALGVIAFEILVGRQPFTADDLPAMAYQHCFGPVPSFDANDPTLAPQIVSLVSRMLEKEPAGRPSMAEVAEVLSLTLGLAVDTGNNPRLRSAPADNAPVEVPSVSTAPLAPPRAPQPEPPKAPSTPASRPTLPRGQRRSLLLPLVLGVFGLAGLSTWLALRPSSKPVPVALVDLASAGIVAIPIPIPDLAVQPDLSSYPDLAPVVGPARPRETPVRKPRCISRLPDKTCILTPGLIVRQRDILQTALAESRARFCPGERLVIAGLPGHPRFSETPPSLKGDAQELLLLTLKGMLSAEKFPAQVEIQCGK